MRYVLLAALLFSMAGVATAVDFGSGSLTVNGTGGWANARSANLVTPGADLRIPSPGTITAIGGWVDISEAPAADPNFWSKYYFTVKVTDISNLTLGVTFGTDWLGGWRGIPAQPWDRIRYEFYSRDDPTWGTNWPKGGPSMYYCTQGGFTDDHIPPTQIYPSDRSYYFQSIQDRTTSPATWNLWVYGKGYGGGNEVDYKQWHWIGQWIQGTDFGIGMYRIQDFYLDLWGSELLTPGHSATVSWRGLRVGAPVAMDQPPPANLMLNATDASLYITPTEQVVINMDAKDLPVPVTGLQAMLNFSSAYFEADTGDVSVVAGGGVWDELIWNQWTTGGDLDVAVGVDFELSGGTQDDATTAVITLNAKGTEGSTQVVFRADVPGDDTKQTFFSDTSNQPVWPAKTNSANIIIDGTAPIITCPADYSTSVATQSIAASASDPVSGGVSSGIASFKMDGSDFTSPTTVVLVPGVNTFDFEAIDKAGNVATKTLTITYTQPAPTIGLYASLAPNVYAGGSSWNAWKANAFTFLLTGVQNGTTPYNTFQDLGFATELDYSTTIVTTGSSTWLGLPCLDSTEWGTAVQFAYVIDNGVVSNPGAAKLDLNYVAGTYRFEFASGEIDFDSYASLAGKTFGGNVSWKGYDYSGGTWVEVTSGSKADMIISVKNRIGNACGPLQSDMDALYAELSGATGDEFLSGKYGITYSGQPGVGDASTGVQTLNFGPVNDDTNPLVAITSPSDGLETNVAALTVTGTASDPGDLASSLKSVAVNGVPVTVTDGAWSIDLTLVEGNNTITVVAEDYAGNTASDTITVLLDTSNPTISINDNFGADPVLQGVYTVTVTASDASSGVAGPPTMNWDGLSASAGTEGPAGTWTYTVTIDDATANGSHTITADISDEAGNPAPQATRTINVNKNQATGQVECEGFVGASRDVTFVATGATTKSWTLTLSFSGGVASYTLTDVPDGVTGLSAKTNWSLRNKLAVTPDGDGQISAIFTGTEKLLGGDINGSNSINILDYSILKIQWMTTNPVADIDGSGVANAVDYNIMKGNWFQVGDLQ